MRRYKDIIAVKLTPEESPGSLKQASGVGVTASNLGLASITAFHARNLEVAEISEEAFAEMKPINLNSSAAPAATGFQNTEAGEQLQNWNEDTEFHGRTGDLKFGIRSVTINVTQICNLKCTYCAAGGDGTYGDPVTKISIEKTLPQLKFFIDKLKDGQKFTISFVGGEPLLYPEAIQSICQYVTDLKKTKNFEPIFSLITNGTLITEKVAQLLRPYNLHITISMDGEAKTNDISRPTKNNQSSTELTLKGLQELQKIHGDLGSLGVSAVVNKDNMNILETYKYFQTLGFDWYEFNYDYVDTSDEANDRYIQQMQELAAYAYNQGLKQNGTQQETSLEQNNRQQAEAELRRIKSFDLYFKLLDDQQRIQNHCGAGKSYLMIDARNQLYTCPWVVNEKTEIVGQGEQLDHAALAKYQKPLVELNNCQTCWARYLCGGGCMYIHREHTGDKHKTNYLFCKRIRGLILTTIMYYKMSRE